MAATRGCDAAEARAPLRCAHVSTRANCSTLTLSAHGATGDYEKLQEEVNVWRQKVEGDGGLEHRLRKFRERDARVQEQLRECAQPATLTSRAVRADSAAWRCSQV